MVFMLFLKDNQQKRRANFPVEDPKNVNLNGVFQLYYLLSFVINFTLYCLLVNFPYSATFSSSGNPAI